MTETPEIDARDAVISSIVAAFDGVGRGNGITIHEAEAIDYYPGSQKEARLLDTEMRWQDIPDHVIETTPSLAFLDAEGFRYYIPAYMIWTLRNAPSSDSISVDYTIYAFTHDPPEVGHQVALLNQEQRCAICRFLRFVAQSDPEDWRWDVKAAHDSLALGWERYCTAE